MELMSRWFRLALHGACYTHRLGVNRVHSEQQGRHKGKAPAPEDRSVTGVHQHERHQAVQDHIHHVKVEWVHARQQNVEPVKK